MPVTGLDVLWRAARGRPVSATALVTTLTTIVASGGATLVTPVYPEPAPVVAPGRASGPLVAGLPSEISSGFDAARDGLPFTNNGDVAQPGGNCWGMSLLAIENYRRRTRDPWVAAISGVLPAPRPTPFPADADPRDQAAAGLAQQEALRDDLAATGGRVPLSDPTPVRDSLERLAAGGDPEVLVLEGQGAHAVVLHGYRDGALQLYDPNYPGETIAWPWSPETGFGPHPKAAQGGFYASLATHTTVPFDAHGTGARIEQLRAACDAQAAQCVGRYPGFSAVARRDGEGLVLVGQAGDPFGTRPRTVWLTVNGRPIGGREVGRFGTFRATVPPGLLRPGVNEVRIVGEQGNQFAGFADLQVVAPPALFAPPAPWGPRPAGPPPTKTRGLAGLLAGR